MPAFPDVARPLHNLQGAIFGWWKCQYCGKQNPIAKLEELSRRQSDVLQKDIETSDLPERTMPESDSKEAAEKADIKATSPEKTPKPPPPKSILKEPKIGRTFDDIGPTTATREPIHPSEEVNHAAAVPNETPPMTTAEASSS